MRENIYATNNEPYNELFSIKELQSALNKKKSTSPGADTIHYDMLKKLSEEGKWQLLRPTNKSWTEGKLPDQWKLGTIIPLLKPNKPPNRQVLIGQYLLLQLYAKLWKP